MKIIPLTLWGMAVTPYESYQAKKKDENNSLQKSEE